MNMNIFSVFTLFGGLAFFLYGMNLMGSGLDKVAGGRLERILEKLTSNPFKAVLFGAGVTAVIQSSSATTVMVVGFVNAGIMKLSQGIGIIMGANLGTTVTAWILSLSGLSGDSFFVQLCKPSTFSPILAFVGILLFMFFKSGKKREIGSIFLGFALLMTGMEIMSGAVKPLADVPEFANILVMFSNPLLGILTGAALTAIIQSSSASVGILQALSATGRVTFATAVPIIMGQNIGTCVTALLSSIGASKNAKRAAIVHLYFNLIGTLLFLSLFYLIRYTIGFSFINDSVNEVSIAAIHTLFNVFSTLILLPFSKALETLACKTIQDQPSDTAFERPLLDERFLNNPGFAIEQCRSLNIKMAELAKQTFLDSMLLLERYQEKEADRLIAQEDIIDHYEDVLGTFLVKLSSRSLSNSDSRAVSMMLHSIGDFERIGDHAVNIVETAKEIYEKKLTFSSHASAELSVITGAVREILTNTISAFTKEDLELAKQIEPLEEVIDLLRNELKNRHVSRLQKGECTIELGFVFSDILTNYERVSDHCSNLAVSLLQISENSFETHEYLNEMKHTKEQAFRSRFEANKSKYTLPQA